MTEPAVVAGIIAGLVSMVMPRVMASVKRKENGRLVASAAELRRIEAAEVRLKDLLDRQGDEIVDLHRQLREERAEREALGERLERQETQAHRNARRYDGVLSGLLNLARQIVDDVGDGEMADDLVVVQRQLKRQRERVLRHAEGIVSTIEGARLLDTHGDKSA